MRRNNSITQLALYAHPDHAND